MPQYYTVEWGKKSRKLSDIGIITFLPQLCHMLSAGTNMRLGMQELALHSLFSPIGTWHKLVFLLVLIINKEVRTIHTDHVTFHVVISHGSCQVYIFINFLQIQGPGKTCNQNMSKVSNREWGGSFSYCNFRSFTHG